MIICVLINADDSTGFLSLLRSVLNHFRHGCQCTSPRCLRHSATVLKAIWHGREGYSKILLFLLLKFIFFSSLFCCTRVMRAGDSVNQLFSKREMALLLTTFDKFSPVFLEVLKQTSRGSTLRFALQNHPAPAFKQERFSYPPLYSKTTFGYSVPSVQVIWAERTK